MRAWAPPYSPLSDLGEEGGRGDIGGIEEGGGVEFPVFIYTYSLP